MDEREALPSARHEVIIYTDYYEMKGMVEARPARRLLDVLNDKYLQVLTLLETSLRPLSVPPESRALTISSLVLNKKEILLAWLVKETKVDSGELVTVHKLQRAVTIYAGPFIVRGSIHAVREETLAQALDAISDEFVAVTEPYVVSTSSPAIVLKGGIIAAVKRDRIMALQERKAEA
jgi:hypothetical protein